jgi:anti-sigma factor RsiW
MQVTHVTELLSPFLDDEIAPREREQVQRHLEVCPECRLQLESLRATLRLVRSLDPVKVPDGFRDQVRSRLSAVGEGSRERRRIPRWSWQVAAAAAAVLIIGVFSVNLFREIRPIEQAVAPERGGVNLGAPGVTDLRSAPPVAPSAAQPQKTFPQFDGRKIVRTAQLAIDVDQFDDASRRLVQIAERAGGFVAESSYAEDNGVPTGSFTLRVPAARFAAVLAELDALGEITQRQISGQDVTEEFVDLQARIRNLERHEQRLLSFMDRATKVSDLLAIEEQLARVRGEIEQLTGRMRFLERSADLATVAVAVKQKAKKTSGGLWDISGTLSKMRAAFLATVRQIVAVVEWFGVTVSALVPVLLLAAGAWLLIRRVRLARL